MCGNLIPNKVTFNITGAITSTYHDGGAIQPLTIVKYILEKIYGCSVGLQNWK